MNYHQVIINEGRLNTNGTLGDSHFADTSYPSVSQTKGGTMNKLILISLLLLTSACGMTKDFNPLVDLKGSKNGAMAQEDKIMCRAIIKMETNALYAAWYDRELITNCMQGRGHSVLNDFN